MIKPIDLLGLGPEREETYANGVWTVKVTPPEWSGFNGSSIQLTQNQYDRYRIWREGMGLIQELLPELTASQREVLITGVGPGEFDAAFGEDE